MEQNNIQYSSLLRRRAVEARTGLSRSGIYDRLNPLSPRFDASFPRPVKLGQHAIGFVEAEVDRWIQSLIAKRDEPHKGVAQR